MLVFPSFPLNRAYQLNHKALSLVALICDFILVQRS